MSNEVINFDPNIMSVRQTVRLTFAVWDYYKTVDVVIESIGGRCASVITTAVDKYYDDLFNKQCKDTPDALPSIVLVNSIGEELPCEDDENLMEMWLESMLVKAEIISFEEIIFNN